jgi:hypothetical protein
VIGTVRGRRDAPQRRDQEVGMELLVWIGAAISVAGLAGLVWCIVAVARMRRSAPPEDEMRARLRRAVTVNLASFMTSVLGLIMVAVGVILS